jgi:glycosyltransferase involved in cell wall biosynthesis
MLDENIQPGPSGPEPVHLDGTIKTVALVHDYLNQRGGAERVVRELSDLWPDASIYTSLYRPGSTLDDFRARDVRTSVLDRLPVDRGFRNLFPLYPLAFRSLGTVPADLVISSSSGWAHAVHTRPDALHVVYCHTPARWLYGDEYFGASFRLTSLKPLLPLLRSWDKSAAKRPDLYVANSKTVQRRIQKIYHRDATVIHPPVEVDRFTPAERGERLLVVSRLLPYKRVDVVVEAAKKAGICLDVVGTGPSLADLRRIAGPTVTFHGQLSDTDVTHLMERCRALCVAAKEDFGITPVEAMAAGKPVVAYGAGGALETVLEGITGVFFRRHDVDDVIDALARCDQLTTGPTEIAHHARSFSEDAFRERLLSYLKDAIQGRFAASHSLDDAKA